MKEKLKLNVVLAKTDVLSKLFKNSIIEYLQFFTNKQGCFLGEKKTYIPSDDAVDEPNRRATLNVVTTVDEKLSWFERINEEYLKHLFDQERTNSSGVAKAELIVEGTSFGTLTSLELLRLKSILEDKNLKDMYSNIPTRSDAENWTKTSQEMYTGRDIYELPLVAADNKTTIKESYILEDPNVLSGKATSYSPQIGTKHITSILGKGSYQKFSGEWSNRQRAELLRRKEALHIAVIEALKKANNIEILESDLNIISILRYIHRGEL